MHPHCYFCLFRAVFYGVCKYIVKHLWYTVFVGCYKSVGFKRNISNFLLFVFGVYFILPYVFVYKIVNVYFRKIKYNLFVVKTGKLKKVTHKKTHSVCFGIYYVQKFHCRFPVVYCTLYKCFRIAFYSCKRCS